MPRLQPVRYTKIDDRPESMIAREKLAMASTDGRVDESVGTELNTYQVLELLDGSLGKLSARLTPMKIMIMIEVARSGTYPKYRDRIRKCRSPDQAGIKNH